MMYSQEVQKQNNHKLNFSQTKSQQFLMKSLDIVKSLNFGQNLAEERNAKARENILRKGEFLQHSKNMAKVIKS
jgi:hypothetical protein